MTRLRHGFHLRQGYDVTRRRGKQVKSDWLGNLASSIQYLQHAPLPALKAAEYRRTPKRMRHNGQRVGCAVLTFTESTNHFAFARV